MTEQQLSDLKAYTHDLGSYIDGVLQEANPVLREFKNERVHHAIRRLQEIAAGVDPDLDAMEDSQGVRYERGRWPGGGYVLFPVTHAFPEGSLAWGMVSITTPTVRGSTVRNSLLSWAICDRNGAVLLHGEERETVHGSRQGMIRAGLETIRRHGGRRVWPRSRNRRAAP